MGDLHGIFLLASESLLLDLALEIAFENLFFYAFRLCAFGLLLLLIPHGGSDLLTLFDLLLGLLLLQPPFVLHRLLQLVPLQLFELLLECSTLLFPGILHLQLPLLLNIVLLLGLFAGVLAAMLVDQALIDAVDAEVAGRVRSQGSAGRGG